MRLTLVAAILCLFSPLISCRTTSSSDVLHDKDRPTADKDSWVELSREEYLRLDLALAEGEGFTSSLLLPNDHVLAKRAQYWIDLIDRTLRETYPDQLTGVPHPRAGIVIKALNNAHVSTATTCSPVLLRLSPTATTTSADVGILGLVADGDAMVWGEMAEQDCALRPLTPSFLKNLTSSSDGGDCMVRYAADSNARRPIVFLDRPCSRLSRKLVGKTSSAAKGATQDLISNWLTIYSHIFTMAKDEREFVAVIAHELGHYYRAHGISAAVKYDFFYKITDSSLGKRPVEDPRMADLGAKVLEASERLEGSEFAYIDEAGYSYGLTSFFPAFGVVIQTTRSCKKDSACQKACEDFVALTPPDDDPAVSIQDYDDAFMGCANQVAFTVGGKSVFDDSPLKELATSLKKIPGVATQVQATIAENPTWGAVLNDLNKFVLAAVKPDQAILAQAAAQDLGYYTTEQEADELSAEWLAMIGVDPVYATRAYLELLVAEGLSGAESTNAAFSSPSKKVCQTLYKHGWKDAAGAPVFLPLGDYGEPHHNTCYRAWNIDREIRGHKYQVAAPPTIPAPAWSQIKETAAALTP